MLATLAWKHSLKGKRDVRARTPAIDGDSLYAVFTYAKGGFFESSLTCFELSTGEARWEFLVDHVCNQPVLGSGCVYLSSFGGNVHAIGADGKERWRGPDAGRNLWRPCVAEDGSLVVAEIGGGSMNTWCLEPATGQVRWKFENGGHSYSIAAHDDRLVHATARRAAEGVTLYCISLEDGRALWSCDSPEYLFQPSIIEGAVFIGARGSFRAYDLETGKLLDKLEMAPDVALKSEALWQDKRLYLGDEQGTLMAITWLASRSLFARNLRLTTSWDFRGDSEAASRPVVEQGKVFFLSKQGDIHGLDATSGEEVCKIRLGKGDDVGGLAVRGGLLVAAHGRELRCYQFSEQ